MAFIYLDTDVLTASYPQQIVIINVVLSHGMKRGNQEMRETERDFPALMSKQWKTDEKENEYKWYMCVREISKSGMNLIQSRTRQCKGGACTCFLSRWMSWSGEGKAKISGDNFLGFDNSLKLLIRRCYFPKLNTRGHRWPRTLSLLPPRIPTVKEKGGKLSLTYPVIYYGKLLRMWSISGSPDSFRGNLLSTGRYWFQITNSGILKIVGNHLTPSSS